MRRSIGYRNPGVCTRDVVRLLRVPDLVGYAIGAASHGVAGAEG